MRISVLFKVLILTLLGGLFVGCGGGGDGGNGTCFGGGNSTCGTSDDGGGGENLGNGSNNNTTVLQPATAHLVYPALEDNITDSHGMFNLVADEQIEPRHLDEHSTVYTKEIVYHNVDAIKASGLYRLMNGLTYPEVPCTYIKVATQTAAEDSMWCEEFGRRYDNLSTDVLADGIYAADIIFNQEATGCADGSGICDITLIVRANPRYHNHTNPIPLDIFKRAFIASDKDNGDTYTLSADMKSILSDIEKNATVVSLGVDSFHHYMNLSTYNNVNDTIHKYTDQLSVNLGNGSFPQIPMKLSGKDGEGATLDDYKGAHYKLENIYEFESKTSDPYDVNETDTNGQYYYMANVSDRDHLSLVTLCQRTANATPATLTANATNATYACEIGTGNVTAYWWLQGKDINGVNWQY